MRRTLVVLCVLVGLIVGASAPAEAHRAHRYPTKVWQSLGDCESGSWDKHGHPTPSTANWHDRTAPYEGGVHFAPTSWDRAIVLAQREHPTHRYPSAAYLASGGMQIEVAEVWLAHTGWYQWPVCSRKLGLR